MELLGSVCYAGILISYLAVRYHFENECKKIQFVDMFNISGSDHSREQCTDEEESSVSNEADMLYLQRRRQAVRMAGIISTRQDQGRRPTRRQQTHGRN